MPIQGFVDSNFSSYCNALRGSIGSCGESRRPRLPPGKHSYVAEVLLHSTFENSARFPPRLAAARARRCCGLETTGGGLRYGDGRVALMIVEAVMFYVFAALAVAAGVLVVGSRNPVHSVLFLILAFFNAAGLFVLMGAEFLAMILVIVYVGAVAVLFLFVVMMLDIDFAVLRRGMVRYLPVGALVGFILLAELVLVFGNWVISPAVPSPMAAGEVPLTNTRALGDILYT